MFEALLQKVKNKGIQDLSFWNICWKRFVICIIIATILAFPIYLFAESTIMKYTHSEIENQLNKTTLKITEHIASDMYKDNISVVGNIELSNLQNKLSSMPCVSQIAISMYDLTHQTILAKSFETIKLDSQEAYSWWIKNSGYKDGQPKIHMENELMEFCRKYKDKDLFINEMSIINSVLFPSEISANNKNGDVVDKCSVFIQNVDEKHKYKVPAKILIVGNSSDDSLYNLMADYQIQKDQDNQEYELIYTEEINDNINTQSINYQINGIRYQVDCMYTSSFWTGYLWYVLLIELLLLLMCFGIAIITAKNTHDIYNK